MTFFKVNPEDTSSFTIITEPKRKFIQNVGSFSGGVSLYNRRGQIEKAKPSNFTDLQLPVEIEHDGENLSSTRNQIVNDYLRHVTLLNTYSSKQFTIKRYTPNTTLSPDEIKRRFGDTTGQSQPTTDYLINYFDESFQKKWIIQDLLEPFHFGESDWDYPNYHSLNFYDKMCLLYPNKDGRYNLDDNFTIDFRVKIPHKDFSEGVVIQSPGNFSVSLVPLGDNFVVKFQIKQVTLFDNIQTVTKNKWHRVTIVVESTSAMLYIDGSLKGSENLSSPFSYDQSNILSVGAFCNRPTQEDYKDLFRSGYCNPRGIPSLKDDTNNSSFIPAGTFLKHLSAEIHDLILYKIPLSHSNILESSRTTNYFQNMVFFLGPHFIKGSPLREVDTSSAKDISGVLFSPFGDAVRGITTDPFNLYLSFRCAGHLINIENFIGDIVNDFSAPRIIGMTLTGVTRDNNGEKNCDDYLSSQSPRNLFILPCDDGEFSPSFDEISSKFSQSDVLKTILKDINLKFPLSSLGTTTLLEKKFSFVDLNYGIIPVPGKIGITSSSQGSRNQSYKTSLNGITSPADLINKQEYAPLVINHLTKDSSSNQVVIFEISNLFYGKRIKPGTFTIRDHQLKGSTSTNPISISLKDDGKGNIYRADCTGNHSIWNIVGRIFYSEGLLIIKNPHLYFFGSGGFEVEFKGDQNIHTLKIEVIASQNSLNLSTNDPDQELLPSSDPSDKDTKFVWISGINFHDKDYNIVAKTQLAQPIVKRHEDRIMFRVQMDF